MKPPDGTCPLKISTLAYVGRHRMAGQCRGTSDSEKRIATAILLNTDWANNLRMSSTTDDE